MSLVIGFIGTKGAVIAGDMREIIFQGDEAKREQLEKELYSGTLVTEEALEKRAGELGVKITVRDEKSKVSERNGILVGEVSSTVGGVVQKRRLYISAGNYAMAEIRDSELKLTAKGGGSNFVVIGNEVTKGIANKCIKDNWKKGNLQDAIKIIMLIMETAARATASVSKKYILIQTASKADPLRAVEEDMKQ